MRNILTAIELYIQSRVTIFSVIEIIIITYIIYKILVWIKNTQAEQVAKGIILLFVLQPISDWLGFTTLNYIIKSVFTWAFMILVVVFQPELRSALERLGNSRFYKLIFNLNTERQKEQLVIDVQEITKAVKILSKEKIGALIVCEKETGLENIVKSGIRLDSKISTELILNIFTPNRPLHDGAMIVRLSEGKILGAGCLLPLSSNRYLGSNLGTRHRSGLGISEQSDSITIIVSEETGTVSYTHKGAITRNLQADIVERLLINEFKRDDDSSISIKKLKKSRLNHVKKQK